MLNYNQNKFNEGYGFNDILYIAELKSNTFLLLGRVNLSICIKVRGHLTILLSTLLDSSF